MLRIICCQVFILGLSFALLNACGDEGPKNTPKKPLSDKEAEQVALGKIWFQKKGCDRCHATKSNTKRLGPSLMGVSDRLDAEKLEAVIRRPQDFKIPGMLPWNGTEERFQAILAYVKTL